MTRFNPFPKVDCRYGAPMGRDSTRDDFTGVKAFCVSRPQGEYDTGGAYWGRGEQEGTVFAVWERGNGEAGVAYVRARSITRAIDVAIAPGQSKSRKG